MKITISRRAAIVLLSGVVLAAGSGIAYATIPSGDGTISGCAEKRTGILRVIDAEAGAKCLSFENPIGWNARGPQGLKGDKGDKGDVGTPGMSEAYRHVGSAVNSNGLLTTVASMRVPPGSYVVFAKGRMDVDPDASPTCGLFVESDLWDETTQPSFNPSSSLDHVQPVPMAVQAAGVAASPGGQFPLNPEILIACQASTAFEAREFELVALRIGAIR